jgi:D-alanyl-D-alanine carboxypeptidase/D-alanyl-D-alanine-endopeptidase (penicillin-binding protein 4)
MGLRWRSGCGIALALATHAVAAPPPLQHLALTHVGAGQGVYVEAADGTVLVAEAETRPVHPASVTKVASSLALLERLGPAHRFTTRFTASGPLHDGVLDGDLVVTGGHDPFFVYEGAFLVLRRLHALGLRAVRGRLMTRGDLLFNWQPDPAGARLLRTLTGHDGQTVWPAVGDGVSLAQVRLRVGSAPRPAASDETLLVTHESPPLVHVLKILNGYSNNVFHFASAAIGGPKAVEAIARAQVPAAMHDEIVIDNGAGAGTTNRLSPRATVAILRALERALARVQRGPTDVLPVSGVDPGTLQERLLDHRRVVVGKTGTFGSVGACALAGLLTTDRYGVVAFAVLNRDVPVPDARARQDAFVRALIEATGATPWPYAAPTRSDYTLALVN